MKYYFLIIFVFLILASVARANGFGIKFDKPVGNYIVNVDTDTYGLISGDSVNFNFMLWNNDRTQTVDFDNVWVGITRPETSGFGNLFGGLVGKADFGGFRMTYILPEAGDYILDVRYGKVGSSGTTTLAEATFPITIEEGGTKGIVQSNLVGITGTFIAGVLIGVGSILFIKKQKRRG